MAWETLKNAVTSVITENGNNEITGQILQDLLNYNIIPQLGVNKYKGVADTETNPGATEYDVFYLAIEQGVYANFGGLNIDDIGLLVYRDNAWVFESLNIKKGINEEVNKLVDKDIVEDISDITTGKCWNVSGGDIIQSSSSGFTLIKTVYNVVGKKYLLLKGIPATASGSSLLGVLTAGGVNSKIEKTTTPKYNNSSNDRIFVLPNDAEEVRVSVVNSDVATLEVYLCEYEPEDYINDLIVIRETLLNEINKRLFNAFAWLRMAKDLSVLAKPVNLLNGIGLKRATQSSSGVYSLNNTRISSEYIDVEGQEFKMLYIKNINNVIAVNYLDENENYLGYNYSSTWRTDGADMGYVILPRNTRYIIISGDPDYNTFKENIEVSFYPFNKEAEYLISDKSLELEYLEKKDFFETYEVLNVPKKEGSYVIQSGDDIKFGTAASTCLLVKTFDVKGRKSIIATGIQDTVDNRATSKSFGHVIFNDGTKQVINQYYDTTIIGADGLKYNIPNNAKLIFLYVNIADSATAKVFISNKADITVIDTKKINPTALGTVKNLSGLVWNSEGDSITFREFWQPYVVAQTGATLTNTGIGSTKLAGTGSTGYESFCETVRINAVKANNPDILTVMGGTNDRGAHIPIGNEADMLAFTTSTFKGAYGHIINEYLTWKPTLKIVLMTPIYNVGGANNNGDTIKEYAQATREVAEYYGLPCIDLLKETGINSYTLSEYTSDNVHPNDAGARRMANVVIAEFLKYLYN